MDLRSFCRKTTINSEENGNVCRAPTHKRMILLRGQQYPSNRASEQAKLEIFKQQQISEWVKVTLCQNRILMVVAERSMMRSDSSIQKFLRPLIIAGISFFGTQNDNHRF